MKQRLSRIFHIIVIGAVSTVIALWPYLHDFGQLLPGDSGDTLLNLWFFEHNLASLPFALQIFSRIKPGLLLTFIFPSMVFVAGVIIYSFPAFYTASLSS